MDRGAKVPRGPGVTGAGGGAGTGTGTDRGAVPPAFAAKDGADHPQAHAAAAVDAGPDMGPDAGPDAAMLARLSALFAAAAEAPETFHALAARLVDDFADADDAGPALQAALPRLKAGLRGEAHADGSFELSVERDGTVIAAGSGARAHLGVAPGSGLAHLGLRRVDLDALLARIAAHPARRAIVALWPPGANRAHMMLARQPDPGGALLLAPFEAEWPDALNDTLAQLFGLSPREQEILRQIHEGNDPQGIAEADGRALGTVRQQIKSILSKLGLGNRGRVQAFLAAASIALQPDAGRQPPSGLPDAGLRQTVLRGGARAPLGLRSFGDPGGQPCLYVHGALYGFGMLEAEHHIAAALGLHVFGPERRGYGQSPAADWALEAAGCGDQDLGAALAHFLPDGSAAVVVAQDTGLLPALALAVRAPERVAGIVAVSATPPVLSWADSAGMPPQQRVFALTMQRAPGVADALVSLGLARMRRLGAQAWPEAVFAGVPLDEATARAPRNLDAVMRAYVFNTEQAAQGFRIDMTRLYRDWGMLPEALRCGIVFLHGTGNRTVQLARVEAYARRFAQAEVVAVEEAGHTLALSHPALALRHAFAMGWPGASAP